MDKKQEMILGLLARCDAVFWPTRTWQIRRGGFFEARRDYLVKGLSWASGQTDAASRMAASRELDELVADGTILACRPRGGRVAGVRLAPEADDEARRLIGLNVYEAALPFLDELHRRMADDDARADWVKPWVREVTLTGIDYSDKANRGAYVMLTCDMYPLLWRDLVWSNSDGFGRVWYRTTPTGEALALQRISDGTASVDFPPELPTPGDEDLYDWYVDRRQAEIRALAAMPEPEPNNVGTIPLSCSWSKATKPLMESTDDRLLRPGR